VATQFQEFCFQWRDGCGSSVCPGAKKSLSRGVVPCDFLFVGEAPNRAADVLGRPFIGEIGNIMDQVIEKARAEDFQHAFTNIVCCMPRDPENCAEEIPPPEEAILSCRQRLREFIEMCGPKLIMAVENHAHRALREMQCAGKDFAGLVGCLWGGALQVEN
jgi:uracil-DNA glycosylase family 4